MSENTNIQVRNLTDHIIVIPDKEMHRRYEFQPEETKTFDRDTLRRLAYLPGVLYLFRNSLSVRDKDLASEFGVSDDTYEHEYKWSRADIDKCLTTGSLDELLDALDFAPEGVVDTIVQRAIELKLNDMAKRKAIQDKTGKNITSMIDLTEQYNQATGVQNTKEEMPKTRRSSAQKTSSGRRVQKVQSSEEQNKE